MQHTINDPIMGELNFAMRDEGGYIRVNGRQICSSGKLLGSTITSTPEHFESDCKKWINAREAIADKYLPGHPYFAALALARAWYDSLTDNALTGH